MTLEAGKNWAEAEADVAEAIDFCRYYAHQALALAEPVPVDEYPGETQRVVPDPDRSRRRDSTVELPARHPGRDDDRPGGGGQHGRAQAGVEHSDDRGGVHGTVAEARVSRRASSTSCPGPGGTIGDTWSTIPGPGSSTSPGRRRSDSASPSVPPWCNPASNGSSGPTWRWAARTPSSWTRPPTSMRPPTDVVRSAYGFQGQKCSACSPAHRRRRGPRRAARSGRRRGPPHSTWARRVDNIAVGPVISAAQHRIDPRARSSGAAAKARSGAGGNRGRSRRRLLPRADGLRRCGPASPPRPARDLRPGAVGDPGRATSTMRSRSPTAPSSGSPAVCTPQTRTASSEPSASSTSAICTSTARSPVRWSGSSRSAGSTCRARTPRRAVPTICGCSWR